MGPADAAIAFSRSLAPAETPCLWITERTAGRPPDGGALLRVTSLAGPGNMDPKRLPGLRSAVTAFLDGHPEGLIVLECLEYLVLQNGVERVERALADLHDDIAMRGGTLVVFLDGRTANPRLVAWLERELDSLPTAAAPSAQVDALLI